MKTFIQIFSLAAVCFIAACNNTQNSTEESTEEINTLVGDEVSYSTDSTTMNGYIAYDTSYQDKRPGILVVHEWWGHNDYVRMRADSLAQMGYVAIAVDMYGDGKQASHPEEAGQFVNTVISNLDEAQARFDAAIEVLKQNPYVDAEKIGAIGYCFGGSVVLSMANAGYDLDAVAAFHAGVQLPFPPSEDIKAKVLVANGAADPFVPEESVKAYKEAMDKVGADYQYIAYENVQHSFTNPMADSLGQKFELPTAYNAEADKDSWSKMQSMFNEAFQ